MNKLLTLLLAGCVCCGGAFAQTQSELNANAQKAFLSKDRVMTKVLAAVKAELTTAQITELDQAQTAWMAYRDACAESEAAIYSGGSIQPMIYYGAMESLTVARSARLTNMLPEPVDVEEIEEEVAEEEETMEEETPEEAEEEMPEEPDPQEVLGTKLSTDAVKTAIQDTDNALAEDSAMRNYLELLVPAETKLAEMLENQGLPESYLTWITANPETGRDLVMTAVRAEFEKRRLNDRSDYSDGSVIAVTEYLRDQQSADGFTSRPIGQIVGAFTIENRAPYRFYRYLYPEKGLKTLTQTWIDKAAAVE